MTVALVPDTAAELPWPRPTLRLLQGDAAPTPGPFVYDLELDEVTADGLRLAAFPSIVAVGTPGSPAAAPAPLGLVEVRPAAVTRRRAHSASARVRRRRSALVVVVVAVLVALALPSSVLAGRPAQPAPVSPAADAGHVYVVQPGDTLWSIAQRLAPGGDPRPLVDQMATRIGSETVTPGQHLTLP